MKKIKIILTLLILVFPSWIQAQQDSTGVNQPSTSQETISEILRNIWGMRLITLTNDQPVTTGSIVIALIVLGLGFYFGRRFILKRARFALVRLGVAAAHAVLLEKVIYYVMITLIFLVFLQVANIPLTIFTFLGGAIAIAFGFGAQNILNNFISGIIIMIEQPIRIGDMIEVEGHYGSIEEIGARCTRVRSFNGIYILVPNSTLLEKNVINWTLSQDKKVRVDVSVGVEYGSPTRKVEQLLSQAIERNDKILKDPPPIILFTNFGDNALNFEVHFWVQINNMMDAEMVKSALRFDIDDIFRQENIVIAFPQQDTHLTTPHPLKIHLTTDNQKTSLD